MPKASKESASQGGDHVPSSSGPKNLDGSTATFLTLRADIDHAALLKGYPTILGPLVDCR